MGLICEGTDREEGRESQKDTWFEGGGRTAREAREGLARVLGDGPVELSEACRKESVGPVGRT